MSKLPSISGKDCVNALQKIGFYQKRRESSHIILRRDEPFAQVVVPDHQELAKGTLRAIIRDVDFVQICGIQIPDFFEKSGI